MNEGERRLIASRAGEMRDRVARLRDRLDHGLAVDPGEEAWLAGYRHHEAQARAMIRAAKGQGPEGQGEQAA